MERLPKMFVDRSRRIFNKSTVPSHFDACQKLAYDLDLCVSAEVPALNYSVMRKGWIL